MSFYSMGINIGILFGFLLGGWLNEFFGWRIAFLVVGFPGLVVALVVRFTLIEPSRGFSEKITADVRAPPLKEVLALLWSRLSFRHLAMGVALSGFVGYGAGNWMAPFFIRSHGMGTGELGTWLALSAGVGGALGTFAAGFFADRLGIRDKRWYMWIPAVATLVMIPFFLVIFTTGNTFAALIFYLVPGFLASFFIGPSLAMTHGLVGLRMRALGSAILFFALNLIGLGIGPWAIGALSDALVPAYGSDSLRYALLYIIPIMSLWCATHYLLASKSIRLDLANAPR